MTIMGFKPRNHPQQVAKHGGADDATDDRRTPPELFAQFHALYGFTLDAAASEANTKLPKFYTLERSGLVESWAGERVWCNPPFSDLPSWVAKADREMREGSCELACLLLPANRTEQKWWQLFIEPHRDREPRNGIILRTRFLRGRLRFIRPDWVAPSKGDRPPFGCVMCIWLRVVP